MGPEIDEIEHQIAVNRDQARLRLVELRRRGELVQRRAVQIALVAAGVGTAIVLGVVVYRLTRPLSWRERGRRLVPVERLGALRSRARRRGREPAVAVEPDRPAWERALLVAVRAGATAAGSALMRRALDRFSERRAA